MTALTIALDVMGGDFGPAVTVPAALQALNSNPSLHFLLVGKPDAINQQLVKVNPTLLDRVEVIVAEEVVSNDARVSQALRSSRGTSMHTALELVKSGRASACVSAGNTAVLMALAKIMIKPLAGIERPALASVLPTQHQGKTLVLDLGANIECDSTMLVQFAVMGAVIAEEVLAIEQPRVALLNVGEEESKGLEKIRTAAAILKSAPSVNYVGYLEGNDLLTGKTDVLVCDGFVGNVTLKALEGFMRMLLVPLKSSNERKKESWWQRWLGYFLKRKLRNYFSYYNPDHYNGACLLGLRGIVIKSHGSASLTAFVAAIEQAVKAVRRQVPTRIASRLEIVLPKE